MSDESQVEASEIENTALAAIIERAKGELEQMIDLNPQIMLLMDANGTILRANKALLEMLGELSFSGVLGKNVIDIMDCGDPRFFSRLLDESGISAGEALVKLPNRGNHMLRFSVVGSGRGSNLRVIIVEDVTEEKSREVEIKQAHKKEAVRELMGALMHTINQHLTVITVRARLMSMALENGSNDHEEFKKSLDDITDLTMQIAATLSQVSDVEELHTTHYMNGTNILDLNASAATSAPSEDDD